MKPITLAVMSDLHIGRARAKDLWPHQERTPERQREFETQIIDTNYRQRFLDFVRTEKISADYLVIPGDISNEGQHAELHLASTIIREVADGLGVESGKILYVPGNHDSDWEMMKRVDPTGFYKSIRYIALNDETLVFHEMTTCGEGNMLRDPCFTVWDNSELLVIGYNSSWDDNPFTNPNHGAIKSNHLKELEDFLHRVDLSENRLRLFLVHHHPLNYSDPDPDYSDFSAMTNAENLMALLRTANFDMIIHGHKHWPRFTVDNTNFIFPIVVLCAGSFSAQIYAGWNGKVDNQFHLVNVEGRDADSRHVFGEVLSWTYLASWGWIPSREHNGIIHINPFGSYYQPTEIEKALKPILQRKFDAGETVYWSKLTSDLPHLKHLPPVLKSHVLDSMSLTMGFVCHPIPGDTLILRENSSD
jgi:predicted phosphodiesterase